MTRVLAVWCPDWPVVAAGSDAQTAAVVVANGRVVACTAAARDVGVRRGQKLRDAQRRCAHLIVHDEDADAEGRAFEQVIGVVEALCPRVEVIRPGLIAVPARGPSRYYGSEQAAAGTIREAVVAAGFECAVGVAEGTFAATLAARVTPAGAVVPAGESAEFLSPQPVSVLNRPELAGVLTRLGIRTLGDLAALPVKDVTARFGSDGEVSHRLASGREARPPATRRPVEDLSVSCEFDPPLNAEPVVFAAKSLADELHENLAMRGLMCVRVEVDVTLSDGSNRTRLWRHDGMLSSTALAERVRWQLDAPRGRRSGAPPAGHGFGGGVAKLRLVPDQIVLDGGRQLTLWGASDVDGKVERAASRLQSMLGYSGVTRPTLAGGRGPGERIVKVPWGDRRDPALPVDRPWPGQVPTPAPAVVPAVARVAEVVDGDGVPVTVSGRCVVSGAPAAVVVDGEELAVTGWTGPWPARELWWAAARARRVARFQVTTDDGRALLLVVDRGRWFVEATYD
jgi:protein ImuB